MPDPAESPSAFPRVVEALDAVDMRQAALDLVELGLRIFPVYEIDAETLACTCSSPDECSAGKHPRVAWASASSDKAVQVEAWWKRWPNASIGLPTGVINGFVVADFDGPEGLAVLRELEAFNGGPFQTPTAKTGRGIHLFFSVSADSLLRNAVNIRPKLDRRGSGGYVVCSPSLHASGERYAWVIPIGSVPLLPAPRWLEDHVVELPAAPVANGNGHRHDRYVESALEKEVAIVRGCKEGTRNDQLNKSAFNLGTLVGEGLTEERARRELVRAALLIGLGKPEALRAVNNGLTAGQKAPRTVPPLEPRRSSANGTGEARAVGDEPSVEWRPSVADRISGLPQLSKIALSDGAQYRKLADQKIVYTWQDVLVAGTIGVLAGAPGSGKTTLAYLYAAMRASRGRSFELLERVVYAADETQSLVIIEAEHSEPSAARKLLASLKLLEIDDSVLKDHRVITIARKAVTLGSPAWLEVVQLMAAGLVSDLIVDTVARFAPADANAEAEQVAIYDKIAQALEQARKDRPLPTCLLVAHTRKGAASEDIEGVSGSTQRVGQADTVLLAEATREGGRVLATRVTVVKLREDPGDRWPLPMSFSIAQGELTQERAAPTAGSKAAAEQQSKSKSDEDAYALAELVTLMPGLGTRELRKVASEKLNWGTGRYDRVENRLKQGVCGVRLVDRTPGSKKCEWVIQRDEPSTPYSEVD